MKSKKIKLSDLCDVITGFAFKSTEYKNYGIPLIRISNIYDNEVHINNSTVFIDNPDKSLLENYSLIEGDILMALSGATTGKLGIVPKGFPKALLNQRVAKFIPSNLNLNKKYLRWFLNQSSLISKLIDNADGSAQPNISPTYLKELEIELPPIEEQKRIASILDKADRIRHLRKYVLELTDSFLQSVFLEMFGEPATNSKKWGIEYIDDVLELSQYGTSKASNNEQRGYPLIGMGNLTYGGFLDTGSYSYVELDDDEFNNLKLEINDVVFNRTNSTELVGKTALWNKNIDAV